MSINIPFDIQVQIIENLPVKSLIRFTSVCKAWKSLINSSEFVAGYRVRPTQPDHLLIRYEVGDRQKPEVKSLCFVDDETFPQQMFVPTVPPLLELINHSRIINSCCGLLCLEGFFSEPDNSITHMVVLWNPSIRKSIAVAVPRELPLRPFTYVTGFGVCPDTMDPKIVKITYIDNCFDIESISCIPSQVMVFTLSSGEWKTTQCSSNLPRKSIEFTHSQTVIGRFIYWIAYDRIADGGGGVYMLWNDWNLIMSFDMSTQEFREVDLPHCMADLSLSRLRGSLAVLECCVKDSLTWMQDCTVWIMEEQGVFTKLFTITAPNASVSRTLGFRESGEPIVEMRYHKDIFTPSALAVYEPCSEHIKDLGICGNDFLGSCYTDSLLLLDHDDGHIVRCGAVKR